jgi:hypothetical protein
MSIKRMTKDEREAEAPLLEFINKTPGLVSLLYDLNALPEQATGQIRANMRCITIGWMSCENWHGIKPGAECAALSPDSGDGNSNQTDPKESPHVR